MGKSGRQAVLDRVRVFVKGRPVEMPAQVQGKELRRSLEMPQGRMLVLRPSTGGGVRHVGAGEMVQLQPGDEFDDVPVGQWGGTSYDERKLVEILFAGELFPPYDFDREALGWLRIRRLPLPRGWNKAASELLILIPEAYPEIPPDKFYLDPDLRDRNGHSPGHYFKANELSDSGWAWLCLHLGNNWAPRQRIEDGDHLVTVIERIQIGLAGEVKQS